MKKLLYTLCALFLALNVSSCGYKIHSYNKDSTSLIGDGTSTVSIGEINQNSLYANVPYLAASQIRDEVVLRRIAKWQTQGMADYSINLNIPTFRLRNFESTDIESGLVSSLTIIIYLTITDNNTGQIVWNSNRISYTENFLNQSEATVINEVLTDVIKQAFDLFQSASF